MRSMGSLEAMATCSISSISSIMRLNATLRVAMPLDAIARDRSAHRRDHGPRCIDVAALVAAAVLRKNPDADVLAFSDDVVPCRLNPRDSVMTNAQKLAALPSGGTNCSAPLRHLNSKRANGDLAIFVSDNMSWVDGHGGGRSTATMQEWEKFRTRNPRARLICLDVQPSSSTQAAEREDILNIGGFSDAVFEIIAAFAADELNANHWVGLIEKIDLQ